jgi:hypothetical protein
MECVLVEFEYQYHPPITVEFEYPASPPAQIVPPTFDNEMTIVADPLVSHEELDVEDTLSEDEAFARLVEVLLGDSVPLVDIPPLDFWINVQFASRHKKPDVFQQDMNNPIFEGAIAAVVGNFVGDISNRLTKLVDDRLKMVDSLKLEGANASLLENVVGIFLHVGVLSVSTEFVSRALPWLTQSTAGYTLYLMGLFATSGPLQEHLVALNRFILNEERLSENKEAGLKAITGASVW